MTREEAIKVAYGIPVTKAQHEALQFLIPELVVSEDERMCKAALEGIEYLERELYWDAIGDTDILDVKDYLEKQKGLPTNEEMLRTLLAEYEKGVADTIAKYEQEEQNPEHFELKAGKWYICHHAFCCRADHLTVQEGERFMCEKDGVVKGFVIKEPEKYFIECSAPAPMEDEQEEQKPVRDIVPRDAIESCMLRYLQSAANCNDDIKIIEDTKKYKEELLKIIEKEWSEEDKKQFNIVLDSLRYAYEDLNNNKSFDTANVVKKAFDWMQYCFKSLHPQKLDASKLENFDPVDVLNRIKMEWPMAWDKVVPKQEWSDEDSDNLERLDNYLWMLDDYVGDDCAMPQGKTDKIRGNIQEILSPWLKSLSERFNLQPKQEWSEEDKKILESLISLIETISEYYISLETRNGYVAWLKSLPERFNLTPKQEWSEVELEFRGEKVKVKRPFFRDDKGHEYSTAEQDEDVAWYALRAWCEKKGVSLYDLYPRDGWSEEDEKILNELLDYCNTENATWYNWLKSLRSKTHKKIYEVAKHELAIRFMSYLDDNRPENKMCLSNGECEDIDKAFKEIDWKKIMRYAEKYLPYWEPSKQNYDGNMDKECIKLCDTLNSIPSIDTFESCCGHLKDRYSIWFFCNDIIAISRLGRCVERNYSDGKWELLVDSIDTHPTGVFCLRSKVPFQSYDEMEKSVNELCNNIQYWFNTKFDSNFNGDVVNQELHWKPNKEQLEALKRASTNEYLSAKQFDILVSLYKQLKKL